MKFIKDFGLAIAAFAVLVCLIFATVFVTTTKASDPNKENRRVSQPDYVNVHQISSTEAKDYIERWQGATDEVKLQAIRDIKYVNFQADAMRDLLMNEGVTNVHSNFGLHKDNTFALTITGTDSAGNWVGICIQKAPVCPPYCPGKVQVSLNDKKK
jgi:hypothetical protein